MSVLTEPFRPCELTAAIKQLKCKKSPGKDGIHPEFLIRMGPKAKETMLTLYNKIWETSFLINQWKVAIVIPVLKRAKTLATLTIIGLSNLQAFWLNLWKEWSEQAGFRPQRSSNQQVASFSQHIKYAHDARNTLTAVFVDIKSAYDLVWKEKLILKLAKFDTEMLYQNPIFYKQVFHRELSQAALFSISSSITAELAQTVTGIKCLLYADDLVLWYSAPLISALKLLANWYKDTTIEKTNEFTYLGMTFDTKLTWKNHIAKIAERVSNRLNVLKRLAGSLWGCASSTLDTTYKMFIQPIMLCCCEPLITATEVILKPLEKAHNQALRLITGEIKSTPIDAMLQVTGSTTIGSLIKEKALILSNKGETQLALSDITDWPGIEAVADWPRIEAVAEFNFGQESKPLLSLDYVPDGLPGKTPSKIGSIQSRCNELKARTKENHIADWPRIEAEFRLSTGHDCLAKHLHRLGLYTQPTCSLSNLQDEMEKTHLTQCPA
ncbi:unnamed protein product, partial [Rodentolepis nana]